jgi:hypothetical protein
LGTDDGPRNAVAKRWMRPIQSGERHTTTVQGKKGVGGYTSSWDVHALRRK